MARRSSQSSSLSKGKALLEKEARLKQAISTILNSETYSNSTKSISSILSVSKEFNVSRTTLKRRLEGIESRSLAFSHLQILKPSQEKVLKDWIKALAKRAIPLSKDLVQQKAEFIVKKKVGKTWYKKFLSRNPDLKLLWTSPLESSRAQALNSFTVKSFFDLLFETLTSYHIKPSNIYNMDEKGVQMGLAGKTRVLVDRDQKTVSQIEDGNKELVTIVECICTDGTVLKPLFIMKGARTSPSWGMNNPIHAHIASSQNGWTDQELGSLWLEKVFHPESLRKLESPDEYRLLILDGHNSHCSLRFLGMAEEYHIIILCLPPHTTHMLQPCDVGVFSPLSTFYKKEVAELARQNVSIGKHNVIKTYANAREKAFTPSTVQAAFLKCGIHPFNPDTI
ncbi:DDE-domain-containing protein, partial [Fomitiporia mediterranea MF3/22]|uniref:DDE-domain-containing protein n=1 Tax=Fomitiporia mediterranea (strain MF3/22) TaxID=694068 RepID=UPI0004408D4C